MKIVHVPRSRVVRPGAHMALLVCAAVGICMCLAVWPVAAASGAVAAKVPAAPAAKSPAETGSSLEAAAAKAGSTGRKVAMSLIGLAFAVAGTVLAFRRDFKEAAGVFAVGIVAVLLATPAGLSLLQDTVNSLFGS